MKWICSTPYERWRAETWLTKEPGTVAWVQQEVKSGDVFYDIGANVGNYALLAASLIGNGKVIAFEPHIFTAANLLQNIHANNLQKTVTLITSALHDSQDFLPFNYMLTMSGSSGSQLGQPISEIGKSFIPEAIELKHSTTIDKLVISGVIPSPTLVKIDVDGNELAVLRGMTKVLISSHILRSIQVEVHPTSQDAVQSFMYQFGWNAVERHFTSLGQEALDKGAKEETIFANVRYARAA